MLRESRLPGSKTLKTLDRQRLPAKVNRQLSMLLDGSFTARAENVLVFGNPGSGKSHLLCALGRELVGQGKRVLFYKCDILLQEFLRVKQELRLPVKFKQLSRYDAIIIDDIGYVQQSREEMEVLFSLLANCYEQTSIMLTSNLTFSHWEKIFKDPVTTAAAIDRLIHHSIIIELNLPSYRLEEAKKRDGEAKKK
ncbi:MAG: IS21-like element helper ATPase IstB [Ignavibacteria bacterium]